MLIKKNQELYDYWYYKVFQACIIDLGNKY